MKTLFGKIYIKGIMKCETGIHIGDSKDNIDIGGLDGPVVRRKDNGEPYIPGSSIKGKMRSLLQQMFKENTFEEQANSKITALFGCTENRKDKSLKGHSSRIIVRDAYLTRETAEMLLNSNTTDMPYTEQKYENTIDRVTGATVRGGVRNQERVPAGAEFNVEFIINILGDNENDIEAVKSEFINTFNLGIKLIENDYLGGSGSRGYGQVSFKLDTEEFRDKEYYTKANS